MAAPTRHRPGITRWRTSGTVRFVKLRVVLAVTVVAVGILTACGSDGAPGTSPGTSPGTTPDTGSVATTAPSDQSDDQTEALDAESICERLTIDSVAADTGLDVVLATPDDSATPQCSYEYTNDTGGVSNLTVASMRSEDVGGLTGQDAFDFVVQINTEVAGADAETQEISAGDAAVRLSGSSLHLGVVQVGERVLTVIIPVDDVKSDAADSLIGTMATTLG